MTRTIALSSLNAVTGLLAGLVLALAAPHALAAPISSGHVTVELAADATGIAPGGTIHLALDQKIAPGWHTYWRNPGDSGQATALAWTLPTGWSAGDIVWATPKKLPIGPLMDYGYEDHVLLPVSLTAPATARVGQTVPIKLHADYLVCKDVCVPESADLSLTLPVTAVAAAADPIWGGRIAAALADAPKPAGLKAAVTPGPQLKLSIVGAAARGADVADAYFYPYDSTAIDHAQAQIIERGPEGLTLTLAPGSGFKDGKIPANMAGLLAVGGKMIEITATVGPPLPGASGLGAPVKILGAADLTHQLLIALVSAFLGGLFLNLMPCVFPVLSMKAIALARHAHGRSTGLHGLAFLVGVVATFLGLAGALIAARAAGQAVGWGFQLQSAPVVAGLCLLMLLAALNLSGVFEFGESLQGAAGAAGGADKGDLAGSVITGALAVAVAAPCTAPFMGPAIGFALTQGPIIALAIFLALALGLAAPFTVICFAPGLMRLLPKPGAWMSALKSALAFPLYGAAAWLAWVISQQAGSFGLAAVLAAGVLVSFAAWVYGAAQSARIVGGMPWVRYGVAAVSLAFALALAIGITASAPTQASTGAGAPAPAAGELPAEPFSPQRLADLRAQGKPVFVNFTAAWCVTCQVNDRVALSGHEVAEAFKAGGVTYMVGDWTNRDATIAKALAEHGRAGVPLYLVYRANGGEPAVLPQILTSGLVLDAVRTASAR